MMVSGAVTGGLQPRHPMRMKVDTGEVGLLLAPLLGQRLQVRRLQSLQTPRPLGQPGCLRWHAGPAGPGADSVCIGANTYLVPFDIHLV